MKNFLITIFFIVNGIFVPAQNNTVVDIDSNVYHTVTIGRQVWMVENLRTARYRNGDPIHYVTMTPEWINLTSGACCDYDNTISNGENYGKLYNWYAVNDNRKIAPEGWHVPSAAEWDTLITYLGGEKIAGGKLKEKGNHHWLNPNTGATNESGFTALPGGNRYFSGQFLQQGIFGFWWSSTRYSSGYAYFISLNHEEKGLGYYKFLKWNGGLSVRCVKN
ncbi:MAG TPA: fibrobacter succinogenes major paralogous domain-containing protein [Prolixibacteraceae bacterium]|nr:fibrobacter succinogenes major paralogous domain-containing protein [Prolixibacteraceae bacterium]